MERNFPRVQLPDTDAEKRDALAELRQWNARLTLNWARALAYKITRDGSTLYMGTVPAHVKEKRRAQGKRAKRSRKINRG